MCDPVTIAMTAVTAAGSAIKGGQEARAVRASVEARNKATQEEIARQKIYQDQSAGVWNNLMSGWTPQAQADGLTNATGVTTGALNNNAPTSFGSINSAGASEAANSFSNFSLGDALQQGQTRDAALGGLMGYDQQQFGNDLSFGNANRNFGTISDFARVSSSLSPLEQELAMENAYQQNKPGPLGDILMTIGSMGMNAAGNGMFGRPSVAPVTSPVPRPRPRYP